MKYLCFSIRFTPNVVFAGKNKTMNKNMAKYNNIIVNDTMISIISVVFKSIAMVQK